MLASRLRLLLVHAAALLALGCGRAAPPTQQEADHAFELVWEQTYGQTRETRPSVDWRTQATCYDQYGNSGLENAEGGCFGGWAVPGHVVLLIESDLGATYFAHELYHCAYYIEQPDWLKSVNGMDAQHATQGWYTLVPEAESKLR